jgi:ParB-like chromosome segregation protein Spo0J
MEAIEAGRARFKIAGTQPQSWDEDMAAKQTPWDKVPAVRVTIESLVIAGSPRLSGENEEHVQALTNAEVKLPPITVHRSSMRVLDGMHRLRAAERRGQKEIEVQFFNGNEADAFVIAVRSNIAHGLPLSRADRKLAATRIITSHPHWSDRLIASVTGLAPGTIAAIRRKPDAEVPSAGIRIGRDGRTRPINSAERRGIASKLLIDDPNLSLRQVASIAGISPETVRDVRDRLVHQENAIPPKQVKLRQPNHLTKDRKHQQQSPHGRAAQEDLNQVMRQLRSDPTLRGTETGRMLLRLLEMRSINSDKWIELCDNVPAHCKEIIATLATECAEIWKQFSERLGEQDIRNRA